MVNISVDLSDVMFEFFTNTADPGKNNQWQSKNKWNF